MIEATLLHPFCAALILGTTIDSPRGHVQMPIEISVVTGSEVPIYRQILDQICRALPLGNWKLENNFPVFGH